MTCWQFPANMPMNCLSLSLKNDGAYIDPRNVMMVYAEGDDAS
jgi:hypothetical protein